MKTSKLAAIICASWICCFSLSNAATTVSVSLWAYDQAAGNTPYYSHYSVTRDTSPNFWNGGGTPETVAIVNLLDSGWGFHPTTGWSSYHVFSDIQGLGSDNKPLRTVGWHQYEFLFNLATSNATIFMDGTPIHTRSYTGPLNWFSFNFNGHTQESVIDDFLVKYDGATVYQQSFDTASLDSGWVVSRQEPGGYVTSGDTSNPRSGNGALALGANVTGIVFDLNSVPEPSSMALFAFSALGLLVKRKR